MYNYFDKSKEENVSPFLENVSPFLDCEEMFVLNNVIPNISSILNRRD